MDNFEWNIPQRGQQQPETCFAEFYLHAVRMGAKSEAAGREIFEDREFVRILVPGDSKTVVERQATEQDKQRFSRQYEAWKKGGATAHDGTPLDQWPVMSPARIREMNALNVFTVENVASLSDTAMQRVGMGARELVVKAKAFLAQAHDSAASQKYASENEELKADVKRLTEQVGLLATRIQEQKDKADG